MSGPVESVDGAAIGDLRPGKIGGSASMRTRIFPWLLLLGVLVCASGVQSRQDAARPVQGGEMAGYLIVPTQKVPESFNAGFSMYVAAWPLLKTYPGHRFQSG